MRTIAGTPGHRRGGSMTFRFLAAAGALLALLALFTPGQARAQLATADVLGTVTDNTGAVIPNAKVTLLNTGTGIAATADTNSVGEYLFSHVQIGTFKVTIEAKNFKKFSVADVILTAGQRARIDTALQIGSQVETVEVEASAAVQLQSDSSDINATIGTTAMAEMPTNGRNYYNLIALQAGTAAGSAGGGPNDNRQSMGFSANGQSAMYNNNMIDGMDNNERSFGSVAVEPSIDALQEVQVETSNYSAEYSRTGGGIANLITKSGTNQYHGSAFEYMRNDDFDAYPWTTGAKTKTELRQNQFGGSLGGPIFKNKAFFFGDYMGWRLINGGLSTVLVPTPAEYTDIHNFAQTGTGSVAFSDQFDAWSGNGGNLVVNQNGFTNTTVGSAYSTSVPYNPLGLAYLLSAPPASSYCTSQPGGYCMGGRGPYNYQNAANTVQNADTYDGRIDYHFNDKNKIFGRFSYDKTLTTTPSSYQPEPIVNGNSKLYYENTSPNPETTDAIALDWVHIFNPMTLLEVKAGYMRMNEQAYTVGFNTWKLGDISSDYTCGTGNGYCYNAFGIGGLPWLQFSNPATSSPYSSAQSGDYMFNGFQGDGGYEAWTENTFQYNASLTLNRKSHSIKMGVGVIRRQINAPDNSNDQITYSANYTGNALADMLEGLAYEVTGSVFLVENRGRMWEPSLYIQDDWRASKALTLNLGVRYDIYTPMTDRYGNLSNFNFNTDLVDSPQLHETTVTGQSFNASATSGINTDYSDVSPRIGFAYSLPGSNNLSKSMVLRGGFGISYFPANEGTPGGLHEYELLNAPFEWGMGCGGPGSGQTSCLSTAYANNGDSYAVPAANMSAAPAKYSDGFWWNQPVKDPVTGNTTLVPTDYGAGGYNLQYGLPQATYNTALATNPANYASSLQGSIFIPSKYKPSYLLQYNLQLQKQLGNNIMTAGFVGNLSRRNNSLNNLNQPTTMIPQSAIQAGGATLCSYYPLCGASSSWMAGVPVETVIPGGNASWTAGEATYERRMTKGFSASVNYTWARSEGEGTGQSECVDAGCQMDGPNNTTPVILTGWRQYGYSGSTSHRAAGMLTYAIPYGSSLHGILGAAAKGWTLAGTGNWNTGAWNTVTMSANRSQIQGYSYLADNGNASEHPDKVPGVSVKPAHQTLQNWINPAAFELPTWGTLGNGTNPEVQGPRARDADLSINKTFSVAEGFKLNFRADAFNFTNTPNYDPPPPPGGGGTYAISSWTGCPGGPPPNISPTDQACAAGTLPVPASVSSAGGNSFGDISSVSSTSRVFQFALKLIY